MGETSSVWVAGHRGMVGSALSRRMSVLPSRPMVADRRDLDLRDQAAVGRWLADHRPASIILAAATVGGILANAQRPADFLYDNLMIAANVVAAAHEAGVERLLFLGSSCIYPRLAPQPIREEALLTGPLEPTNEWYALAKIAGVKLCQAYRRQHGARFISAMPTNLYGPGDNFDPQASHVLPALLRRVHEAKESGARQVAIWGSGTPLREFLHVDDLAEACLFLLDHYDEEEPINVGSGEEIAIGDLARLIAEVVGYEGEFVFDATKPDGTPRKLLDSSRLHALGWRPRIGLREGVEGLYRWYGENLDRVRL